MRAETGGEVRAAGRCLAVGGGAGRSGASEQVLAAAVGRCRLNRWAQLRNQRDIPCGGKVVMLQCL